MKTLFFAALILAGLTLFGVFTGYGHDVASVIAAKAGISMPHEKLGWLDDAELSDSDRTRIAEITGAGHESDQAAWSAVRGSHASVSRDDFELLRQDRRRARAAYPDVGDDDLYTGSWFSVDLKDRVPEDFCTSGNSNGTQGADGKFYLDGDCYLSVVRPKYDQRADAAATRKVLAELKDARRQKRLAHIERWGYSLSMGGTGSVSVNAYPDPLPSNEEPDGTHVAGKAVIVFDGHDRYEFPFKAADWIDPPWSHDELVKFATDRGAVKTAYVADDKPWVVKDGLLSRGQTCAAGRLCQSRWNVEKDDFDTTDLGPDTPAAWVLEQPFGLAYLPAPDNGEQRSQPGKPWYVVVSFYGSPVTASGGWTEQDAKAALPDFLTGTTWSMNGGDFAQANWGNLKEARATQIPPQGVQMLIDRGRPIKPVKPVDRNTVAYSPGMTLAPGQSTVVTVPLR